MSQSLQTMNPPILPNFLTGLKWFMKNFVSCNPLGELDRTQLLNIFTVAKFLELYIEGKENPDTLGAKCVCESSESYCERKTKESIDYVTKHGVYSYTHTSTYYGVLTIHLSWYLHVLEGSVELISLDPDNPDYVPLTYVNLLVSQIRTILDGFENTHRFDKLFPQSFNIGSSTGGTSNLPINGHFNLSTRISLANECLEVNDLLHKRKIDETYIDVIPDLNKDLMISTDCSADYPSPTPYPQLAKKTRSLPVKHSGQTKIVVRPIPLEWGVKIGDLVNFGTKGVVMGKVVRSESKVWVRTSEKRGSKSEAGDWWRVPYTMLKKINGECV